MFTIPSWLIWLGIAILIIALLVGGSFSLGDCNISA